MYTRVCLWSPCFPKIKIYWKMGGNGIEKNILAFPSPGIVFPYLLVRHWTSCRILNVSVWTTYFVALFYYLSPKKCFCIFFSLFHLAPESLQHELTLRDKWNIKWSTELSLQRIILRFTGVFRNYLGCGGHLI